MFMTPFFKIPIHRALMASIAAAGALTAASATAGYAAEAASPAPATPVSVAIVEAREPATWDEFSGRLEAVERVDVRSRVAGAVD